MLSGRDRNLRKVAARSSVAVEILAHRHCPGGSRRSHAVVRVLEMSAANLAIVLKLPMRTDGARARPVDGAHTSHIVRKTCVDGHCGMCEHRRHLTAMGPGLVRKMDIESESLGHLIVVYAEGGTDVDQQSVDIAAFQAGIGQCVLESGYQGDQWAHRSVHPLELTIAYTDDRRLVLEATHVLSFSCTNAIERRGHPARASIVSSPSCFTISSLCCPSADSVPLGLGRESEKCAGKSKTSAGPPASTTTSATRA